MKIGLGFVACAFLASGFAAFADPASKPLYKRNGELCSTEEAAGKVRETWGRRTLSSRVKCHPESQWKLIRAMTFEEDQELARFRARSRGGFTGEGSPPRPLVRDGPSSLP